MSVLKFSTQWCALLHKRAHALKTIAASVSSISSSIHANYDGEYTAPQMKTTIPGPKSKVTAA